jgi:hypothetical protein
MQLKPRTHRHLSGNRRNAATWFASKKFLSWLEE